MLIFSLRSSMSAVKVSVCHQLHLSKLQASFFSSTVAVGMATLVECRASASFRGSAFHFQTSFPQSQKHLDRFCWGEKSRVLPFKRDTNHVYTLCIDMYSLSFKGLRSTSYNYCPTIGCSAVCAEFVYTLTILSRQTTRQQKSYLERRLLTLI